MIGKFEEKAQGAINRSRAFAVQTLDSQPWATWFLAAIMATAALLFCFFSDHRQSFDDLHLSNISYMYANYGKLVYPAHWQFHNLTLHPPLHHIELGLLLRAGCNPYYAEAVPPFLLFVIGIYLASASRFSDVAKFAFLLAFCVPFLNIEFVPRARPDLNRALAMFDGLIALETGRLANWNPSRLFWGSFLLTYSAVLHYPGFLTFTGVFVYVVWVVYERGWNPARRQVLALMAGGLVIGAPFLVFFVIPHWREILAVIRDVDPMGGGLTASLRVHFDVYRRMYLFMSSWPTRILFFLLLLKIPVILVSSLIFLMFRCTRGVALASLPYPLFLLIAVSNHKVFWWPYFLPELMLYVAAVTLLITAAIHWMAQRLPGSWAKSLVPLSVIFMGLALLLCSPTLQTAKINAHPRFHEDSLARSAARSILGPGVLVGSHHAMMWFAGGATYYHDIDSDLLWPTHVPVGISNYFGAYDALIAHHASSDITNNSERKSLISWYADGTLSLRGMYLTSDETLPYLILSSEKKKVEAFGLLSSGKVGHFQEQPNGEYTFSSAVCDRSSLIPFQVPPVFQNTFAMPVQPGFPQKKLETFVLKTNDYLVVRTEIAAICQVRDEIGLSLNLMEPRALLAALNNDPPIKFYEHYEDAVDARWGPEDTVKLGLQNWPDSLSFVRGLHKGETYSLSESQAHILFRSELDLPTGLQIKKYEAKGKFQIQAGGLADDDHSATFYPGTSRDHIASEFFSPATDSSDLTLFMLWVKPLQEDLPAVSIQDESYTFLAHAHPVLRRDDGWTLMLGSFQAPAGQTIRMAIEPNGKAIAFYKLMTIAVPKHSTPPPKRPRRSKKSQ